MRESLEVAPELALEYSRRFVNRRAAVFNRKRLTRHQTPIATYGPRGEVIP
jgi:hypothetical protein